MEAVGKRELLWLAKFGHPRYPQNSLHRALYDYKKVTPGLHINVLHHDLKIARFLVPDVKEMNRPTIRHPDLAPGNILINDNGEICGIIDWQHCAVLPLFLQAKMPSHIQNFGDEDSDKDRPPKLPDSFYSLSEEEKMVEEEIYQRRQLHFFYLGSTSHDNPRHFQALNFHPYGRRATLYALARSPWEGDNVSLQAQLIWI